VTKKVLKARAPDPAETVSAPAALADVLAFPTAENLSTSYDLLKLIGVVVGQMQLLSLAVNSTDSKAAVSAARALASLKEDPAEIAERLKAGPFAGLTTADLRRVVEELQQGKNPKAVLEEVSREKESA
jgi:hypothetical protein